MAIDGTWNVTMDTPLGERKATLTVTSAGGTLTGSQSADGQTGDIYDGTVNGDDASWKVDITSPMSMTLEFTGKVAGDALSGSMSAGMYGSWPFTGTRG